MKPLTATVYPRVETNTNGVVAVTYPTPQGTVIGILLPTGGTIVQRQYGHEYSGEFEFYTKRRNAYLVADNRLKINNVWYQIKGVRDYIKATTCLLSEVT